MLIPLSSTQQEKGVEWLEMIKRQGFLSHCCNLKQG